MCIRDSAQTALDYRHYDEQCPNRITPVDLPSTLKMQLHQLMLELGLTSGSIDFIRTKMGQYIFLEVNPVGQFSGISTAGNLNLEKRIAELLIGKSREYLAQKAQLKAD